ncbi:MAG: hypothetical protein KDI17_12045 [Halioglobus sp.]|nr:hypothetical protein [Halioglobus sp.]
MQRLITAILFTATLFTANAHSAATGTMSVADYEASKADNKSWQVTQVYLNGVGVGAALTAATLAQKSRPTLFCQPEAIELNSKSYLKLIDAFIRKNDIPADTAIESVLIMALVVAFPCS